MHELTDYTDEGMQEWLKAQERFLCIIPKRHLHTELGKRFNDHLNAMRAGLKQMPLPGEEDRQRALKTITAKWSRTNGGRPSADVLSKLNATAASVALKNARADVIALAGVIASLRREIASRALGTPAEGA